LPNRHVSEGSQNQRNLSALHRVSDWILGKGRRREEKTEDVTRETGVGINENE